MEQADREAHPSECERLPGTLARVHDDLGVRDLGDRAVQSPVEVAVLTQGALEVAMSPRARRGTAGARNAV